MPPIVVVVALALAVYGLTVLADFLVERGSSSARSGEGPAAPTSGLAPSFAVVLAAGRSRVVGGLRRRARP